MNTSEKKPCLYLCMGSACHQMGVIKVLPKIQELFQRYNLEVNVELKGSFCLGPCADGIIMKYGETLFKHIRPDNVEEKFQQEILPHILPSEEAV